MAVLGQGLRSQRVRERRNWTERRAVEASNLWGHTYAGKSEHGVDKQRGAKSIGTPHHVVEEMVLVKESPPAVLGEEIGAEDLFHQVIVVGDVGPPGWLH